MSDPCEQGSKKSYFLTLDFMRGIAAICVVVFHWCDAFGYRFFGSSLLAVDFFFLLSGFVIANAYEARLKSGYSLVRFFLQRLLRLYPMIIAGAVIGFIYFAMKGVKEANGFDLELFGLLGLNLLMFPMTLDATQTMFPLNVPMWSLFFELMAYVAFAVFLLRIKTALLLAIIPVILVPYSVCIIATFGSEPITLNETVFELSFFWRLSLWFIAGILLFRVRHMITRIRMGTGVSIFVLSLLIGLFLLPRDILAWWQYELLTLVLLPMAIMAGLKIEPGQKWSRLAHMFGNLSYPLYVVHLPVMFFLSAALKVMGVENRLMLFWWGVIILPVTMLFAYLLYRFYDAPVRAWLGERLRSIEAKRVV